MFTTKRLSLATLTVASILNASLSWAAPAGKPDLTPNVQTFNVGKVSVKNIGEAESRASWLQLL